MITIELDGQFLIAHYKNWTGAEIGKFQQEALKILDATPIPLFHITHTEGDPANQNIMAAVKAYRTEIEKVFSHPNLLQPTALIVNAAMMPTAKSIVKLPWQVTDYVFASTIEEAKEKLLAHHPEFSIKSA